MFPPHMANTFCVTTHTKRNERRKKIKTAPALPFHNFVVVVIFERTTDLDCNQARQHHRSLSLCVLYVLL